jgi:hypothetical protein
MNRRSFIIAAAGLLTGLVTATLTGQSRTLPIAP